MEIVPKPCLSLCLLSIHIVLDSVSDLKEHSQGYWTEINRKICTCYKELVLPKVGADCLRVSSSVTRSIQTDSAKSHWTGSTVESAV